MVQFVVVVGWFMMAFVGRLQLRLFVAGFVMISGVVLDGL